MRIRPRPRWSLGRDLVIAAAAVVVALSAMQLARWWGWQPLDPLSFVGTILLAGAAWVGARRLPKTTLAVVAAVVGSPIWSFPMTGVRIIPLVIAGVLAALQGVSVLYVAPVYALGIVLALASEATSLMWRFRDWGVIVVLFYGDNSDKSLIALVAGVIVVLGYLVHRQQVAAQSLRARNVELAALRQEEDARIVAETRTAIARDIHDVVAHHMTAVVVTAQSAAADPRRDAEALHDTMVTIAAEGQEALAAMRRAVRMLRTDAAEPATDRSSDISSLVEAMADRVRATGRAVTVAGAPDRVPQFAQVAMARIVQEALTNVMLHSDADAVTVTFTTQEDDLVLRIADDGSTDVAAPASGGGNGLTGMRERARALGGTLTAEGGSGGTGWTVIATLPLRGM